MVRHEMPLGFALHWKGPACAGVKAIKALEPPGPNVLTCVSCGIELALSYWASRGHRAIAFLPDHHLSFEKVGAARRSAELGLGDLRHVADDVPLLRLPTLTVMMLGAVARLLPRLSGSH